MDGPVPVDTPPRLKSSKKPPKLSARTTAQNNADPFGVGHVRDTKRPRRRRSPSPASQDSFAGPLPLEEAEKLFVANTTTFNIPLSELRKSNTDNVAAPQTPSSTRTSAFSFSGLERRVPLPAPPRPLNQTGEILVAETPSNSSRSSNSQGLANQTRSPFVPESPSIARHMQGSDTQLLDESQPRAQPRDFLFGFDRESNGIATRPASPEPSSSYERVLEADPYAPNTQPLVPTQPTTQRSDATQPIDSTQDAGPSLMDPGYFSCYDPYHDLDRQYPLKNTGPSDATANTAATTPRTVGRGLASLIPKHRRWQYQMADADTSNMPAPPVLNGALAIALQAPNTLDTQPSDTNAVHGSAATDAQPVQPPPRRRLPSHVAPPEVDIVPDSEPMDLDAAGTDRGSPENSPAKRVSQRVSQLRLASPVEEAPDPMVKGEEDDEEDEEVPLAVVSDKGKSKAIAKAPRSNVSRTKSSAKRPQGRAAPLEPQSSEFPLAQVKPLKAKGRAAQYSGASAAPSSKASEDTTTAVRPRSRKNGTNTVTKGRVPQSRSGTPATALKRRRPSSSDDETAVSKNAELVLPSVYGDGDTEPADDDDDDMEVDEEEEAPRSKVRSAKRKRVNSVASKSTASRATVRGSKVSGTPLGSAAKRRKVSSSAPTENDSATRVFALWRQDNHYYAGTVHSLVSSSPARYRIHFDDGTVDDVDLSKMRLCKLMEGDQVIVPERQKAVVVDVSQFETGMVIVDIDNGDELDQVEVEVGDIRIASRTFNSVWTNRTLTVEDVCPIVRPHPLKNSPSPSKMTLGSAASVRAGLLHLRKTGFVVTMSPKHDISGKTKDKVLTAIKAAGGVIIDDWTDIFSMDGAFSRDSKRWTAKYEDIKCIVRNKNVEQVFLLSDDHNAKPKYLMALALGIPCLDYNWILKSAGSVSDFPIPCGCNLTSFTGQGRRLAEISPPGRLVRVSGCSRITNGRPRLGQFNRASAGDHG